MNIPEIPPASGYESVGTAKLHPRYEDITQDGRAHLEPLMTGLGAVWRSMTDSSRLREMMLRGTVPILSRIVMLGGDQAGDHAGDRTSGHGSDGPFSPDLPFEVEGTWRLAHETNGERIFLDMWLDVLAPHMKHFTARPAADAPRARVGRVYAEHVVTRPFATTPAERKVTRLDVPGIPAIPEHGHAYLAAADLVANDTLEPVGERVFAMMHTDSNQHVNSLVYPHMFSEAALGHAIERRLGDRPEALLARGIELRYRKPFFTGDRAALAMRFTPNESGLDVVGAFAPPNEPHTSRPSTTIAMRFR